MGPKTLTVYRFEVVVRSARRECSLQSILDLLRSTPTGLSTLTILLAEVAAGSALRPEVAGLQTDGRIRG